jgi:hypothetical protein
MSAFDFMLLVGIGCVGMVMKELNWPRSAFSLGFVLGPSLENYFFLAYQISGWTWLTKPLVLALLGLAAAGVIRQTLAWFRTRNDGQPQPAALSDLIVSGATGALAVAALATAVTRFPFEAALFPVITAGFLVLLSLAIFSQAWLRWREGAVAPHDIVVAETSGEWAPSGPDALQGNLQVLVLCVALSLLVLTVGHLAATLIFVAGGIVVLGRQWRWSALVTGVVTLGIIYAVFDILVSQPWPKPWLAGLI